MSHRGASTSHEVQELLGDLSSSSSADHAALPTCDSPAILGSLSSVNSAPQDNLPVLPNPPARQWTSSQESSLKPDDAREKNPTSMLDRLNARRHGYTHTKIPSIEDNIGASSREDHGLNPLGSNCEFNSSDLKGGGSHISAGRPLSEATKRCSNSVCSSEIAKDVKSNTQSQSGRQIFFNDPLRNAPYATISNVIITSKFTIFTFLPKFLYQSFTKMANFFFLVVCILQSVKSISNTYGYPTNAPVLITVLSIDAIFAIMEDRRRHKADKEANSRNCHIIKNGHFVDSLWSEVRVGDIVQILNREIIPADVLILSVNEPVGEAASGICYVETKSLDGETNLKLRQAIPATMSSLVNPSELMLLNGNVKYEDPNPYISKFTGKVEIALSQECGTEVSPISMKNILLRGCTLRNTEWVYGVVLNTGNDTKIMQSTSAAPLKTSDLLHMINRMILWLCGFLLCACVAAALVNRIWQTSILGRLWYLPVANNQSISISWKQTVQMVFYYFLLLYQLIPISLYVSMTTVKFLQAQFISWDLEMYHEETDTPAIVRSMELNEELGQISYIFSDKTGTLTRNVMEFRKVCINGVSYGSGTTEVGRAARARARASGQAEKDEFVTEEPPSTTPYVNFVDPKLFKLLENNRDPENKVQHEKAIQFFEHLAICHTVIPERLESGEIRLSASSPDEQALVAGAGFMGFNFQTRSVGRAVVNILGKEQVFQVLEVLEFNSTRKRMSVIVRKPNGELVLYTKGADMMVYPRLKADVDTAAKHVQEKTKEYMELYADEGLRTLAIACKPLAEAAYKKWKRQYDDAISDISEMERRKEGKSNAIDNLMEEIECDLELLGATAIEDKLQDGVSSCLTRLLAAGINVWMLTGDKEETAINIGYACSLLDNSVTQSVFNCTSYPTEEVLRKKLIYVTGEHEERLLQQETAKIALIIDGEALELALRPSTADYLMKFARHCSVVICNRVSPAQKAEMVRLVRLSLPHLRTLAIGDGANDVAMIQAAHVGIGISGQEGMQAVNSSDYAIAQFRFLERLLLVHGRWNYRRISKLVLYMFYKNITLVMAQYLYGFLSGASGSKLYWEFAVQVYNIFFTGLPILVTGVLDQDFPAAYSVKYPVLYQRGLQRMDFNLYQFFRWVSAAVYESIVIFLVTILGYRTVYTDESRVEFGMCAFTLTVLVVNCKIWLIAETWNWLSITCWLASIFAWFCIAHIGTTVENFASVNINYDEFGSFVPTANSNVYMMLLFVGTCIALLRHFTWKQYERMFNPTAVQILQQQVGKSSRCISVHELETQTLSLSMMSNDIVIMDIEKPSLEEEELSQSQLRRLRIAEKVNSGAPVSMQSEKNAMRMDGVTTIDEDQETDYYDGLLKLKMRKRTQREQKMPLIGGIDEDATRDVSLKEPRAESSLCTPSTGFQLLGQQNASDLSAARQQSVASYSTSYSASVYNASFNDNGASYYPDAPFRLNKASLPNSRRTTGFAFSCDEETTLAESYIASSTLDKAHAVPTAFRNSITRGKFSQ